MEQTPITRERLPKEFKENHTASARVYEKLINENLTIGLNFTSSTIYICKDFLSSDDTQKCWRGDFTESKLNEIHQFLTGKSVQFGELDEERFNETIESLSKEIEALNKTIKDQEETIEVLELEAMGHDAAMDELKRTIETQALIFADTHAAVENYKKELLNA